MPLALIIVSAVFLPIYRRLSVYTAYEYLGQRFDPKTRLLGAALFLLQRGLGAGITIYAPAIILSTVLGWRLDLTIICSGMLVIIYTVTGGSEAVNLTQKYQIGRHLRRHDRRVRRAAGEAARRIHAVRHAHHRGRMHKLQAVDFSTDPAQRYTFWSGTDRGDVSHALLFRHRPIAGAALHRRRVAARRPARV